MIRFLRTPRAARVPLCGLAVLLAVGIGSQTEAATLGLSMPTLDPFRIRLRDAIQAKVDATPGTTLRVVTAPAGDVGRQNDDIAQLIHAGVDGLIVIPEDASKVSGFTSPARNADIPVVLINNGPQADWLPGQLVMAIPNELVAGRLQMHILAARMGGHGNLAILSGPSSHSAAILRTKGVEEVLQRFPDIHVVERGEADWSRDKAADLMAGWIRSGVRIDAVAANNDEMALGAYAGWVAANSQGTPPLIAGVDASPDGLAALAAHHLVVTVKQDPVQQGDEAVADLFKLIAHQPVPQYDWATFQLVSTAP
ncbi:substrate-binding domain-containing protein [Acetobacteraceae bacterium KSS8]|uniref:Substrate-binding domain-containing protein n=1 Tax=Endosaccharibacter trunci TaxID=2812733 RepID=A0ABT1W8C6_9PROT|nr:substrate-binding domain-containing protein [Acetobacteraceae bacterium KSS8]